MNLIHPMRIFVTPVTAIMTMNESIKAKCGLVVQYDSSFLDKIVNDYQDQLKKVSVVDQLCKELTIFSSKFLELIFRYFHVQRHVLGREFSHLLKVQTIYR